MSIIQKICREFNKLRPSELRKKAERRKRMAEDRKYFRSIKNKHAGQRGFVIGNGPSLNIKDLDLLENEVCIASNKIYLAFDQTKWRPSFFTIVDALVWEKIKHKIDPEIPEVLVPDYLKYDSDCAVDVKTFAHLGPAPSMEKVSPEIPFSDNLEVGAYGGYTVTYENIQLAVHLGLNPIYIIGCDHYYAGEEDAGEEGTVEAPEVSNHFVKNYREPGEIVSVASTSKMNVSYRLANEYAKKNNVTLINATRGGYLEAFPRVDFESLFE